MSDRNGVIDLTLDCSGTGKLQTVNLTQGIPFSDGALARGTPMRLVNEKGQTFPVQAQSLATWNKDLKSVKWILIDSQLPAGTSSGTKLKLEYGPKVDIPEVENPVTVRDEGRHVILSNGLIALSLCRNNAAFLSEIRVKTDEGWRDLLAGTPSPFLYMVDQYGGEFGATYSEPGPTITVEEAGSIRTSVCIKGFHATEQGVRAFPFTLRIHMYANRQDLRVFHTFVLDQDPDVFAFSGIGMELSLKLGDCQRAAVAGEEGSRFAQNLANYPNVWSEMLWHQYSDDAYRVELDGKPFGDGSKTRGWASLQGERGSAAVVLRDSWQEFPKAIALTPNLLDIQLWPRVHDDTLSFKTPWKEPPIRAKTEEALMEKLQANQTAGVQWKGYIGSADIEMTSIEGNEDTMRESLELTEKYLQGRIPSWGDTSTGKAVGLAKTHEFSLLFSAESLEDDTIEDWAIGIQSPALALPSPDYMCRTRCDRLLSACDPKAFPGVEKGLDRMVHALLIDPIDEQRLYGSIDYGDMVNCHARAHGWLYKLTKDGPKKFTDLVGWFNNESTDLGRTLWQYFLRTGKREFWQAAEAFSEHSEDVDSIHAHPTDSGQVGWHHYHSMMHWSMPSPSHSHVEYKLLHYYLTGNRRALEVARETADACLRNQEPSGIYSNRDGVLRREFTVPMTQLWLFYQATWEERYYDCAKRSLDFFVNCQDEGGLWARDVYTDGERGDKVRLEGDPRIAAGNAELLALYDAYRLTKDEKYKVSLVKIADNLIAKERPIPQKRQLPRHKGMLYGDMYTAGMAVAYTYDLTHDERYLKAMQGDLEIMPKDLDAWINLEISTPYQRALDVPIDAHAMMAAVTL